MRPAQAAQGIPPELPALTVISAGFPPHCGLAKPGRCT